MLRGPRPRVFWEPSAGGGRDGGRGDSPTAEVAFATVRDAPSEGEAAPARLRRTPGTSGIGGVVAIGTTVTAWAFTRGCGADHPAGTSPETVMRGAWGMFTCSCGSGCPSKLGA